MTPTFVQKVAWEDIMHILYLNSDIHAHIEVIFLLIDLLPGLQQMAALVL